MAIKRTLPVGYQNTLPGHFRPRRKQDTWRQNIAAPGRKPSNPLKDREGSMRLRELGCAPCGAWLGEPKQKSCSSILCVFPEKFGTSRGSTHKWPFSENCEDSFGLTYLFFGKQTHEKHILNGYCAIPQ